MAAVKKNQTRSRLFSFLRGQESLEITGYHVGDIQEDRPVIVAAGATLVGNVFAPKVTVAGLHCGFVVARDTAVRSSGQVWGDIHTVSFQMDNGGQIRGWVSSIDETTYQQLWNEGIKPESVTSPTQLELPAEISADMIPLPDKDQIDAAHRLQAEAAAALAARVELEQTFDKRLSEIAGEASTRASTLHQELDAVRQQLTTLEHQRKEIEEELRAREAKSERQANELRVARDLLAQKNKDLDELHQVREQQTLEFDQLQTAKAKVDRRLQEKVKEVEVLNDRVNSLETAMQASLQHTAEQEESLLRWQELAEATEAQVQVLEKELKSAQLQLEESTNIIEMLRQQRNQFEEEWQKLQNKLEELQQNSTQPLSPEASRKIARLEATLSKMEEIVQEYHEQLLWYKANLESSRSELEQTRQVNAQQKGLLSSLQREIAAKQTLAENLQKKVEKLLTVAQQQDQRLKKMLADKEAMEQKAVAEKKALQTLMRQTRAQMEANEAELERYLKETEIQGNHLAEIRAELVERELQLKRAQVTVAKQQTFIKHIQEVTTKRIQALEARLAQAQPNSNPPR